MKRQILVNGLLSLTVVSCMTGCVDDKYDLSDVDSTSRFTVNNLTVPVNLSEIRLENVINLDDNDNIKKVIVDGKECYAIVKNGCIDPTEFSIGDIHVARPDLKPSLFSMDIKSDLNVPGMDLAIPFPEIALQDYNFNMHDVDKSLKILRDVKTCDPIKIEVTLSIPQYLGAGNNRFSFQNLRIQLPKDLITKTEGYDKASGLWIVKDVPVDSDGKARLVLEASGLDLGDKGKIDNGFLAIEGLIGIETGEIRIAVKEATLPSSLEIRADYSVSAFDVASFSGKIDYNMDSINIDPISLSGLPEFLDSPETNIIIANPQILVSLKNPVGKYGLEGKGSISLKSAFSNGATAEYSSSLFTLKGESSNLAFCTPYGSYEYVEFDGLRHVLSNGNAGLPTSIKVGIEDINFAGDVTDFPLADLGNAEGDYEFNAPLGFGQGSVVVYETNVDGWSSDDLDDVNINTIHLSGQCSTDLPVSIQLSVVPIDKDGKEIAVEENSGNFRVPASSNNQHVELSIKAKNGPIRGFDGVKFKAIVSQDAANSEALGPDLYIRLDDLRVTVDGYFEKEK